LNILKMQEDNYLKKNWILVTIVIIVVFLLGFFCKYLLDEYSNIEFSNSINWEANPLELVSLIITILLAIYVTRNLSKKNDKEKAEVDLLTNYLIRFKSDLFARFASISEEERIEQTRLNSDCRIIRKQLHSVVALAVQNNYIDENDPLITGLKDKVRDYWELLTDTPQSQETSEDQIVRDGITNLQSSILQRAELTVVEIERLVFSLILKLNKK